MPLSLLQDDEQFFDYIVNSNEALGRRQCIALSKIQARVQTTASHCGDYT